MLILTMLFPVRLRREKAALRNVSPPHHNWKFLPCAFLPWRSAEWRWPFSWRWEWLREIRQTARSMSSEKVVNLGVYCLPCVNGRRQAADDCAGPGIPPASRRDFFPRRAAERRYFLWRLYRSPGLCLFLHAPRRDLPVFASSDVFAPGLALGHGIGRLGCFAAGCCWGKPTRLPWAVTFTSTDTTTGVPLNIPLHPTQLYEAFAEAIICVILLAVLRRKHRDGQVIGLYLLLYGLVRFAVEFVRDHDSSNPFGGPFVLEQWLALALAACGLYLVIRRTGCRFTRSGRDSTTGAQLRIQWPRPSNPRCTGLARCNHVEVIILTKQISAVAKILRATRRMASEPRQIGRQAARHIAAADHFHPKPGDRLVISAVRRIFRRWLTL